ncbi:MAG: hypothetical protein KME10_03925 [Plectolyngbya sp. WJT66-NPBG17]|jgi:hypothetical protein|nr:hypothetical protein [Plectolyngbya sp. WJT66-NPBG17]MBW4527694.1 hypothetical protein [Phormidium tanganyikae FI6-MK23]
MFQKLTTFYHRVSRIVAVSVDAASLQRSSVQLVKSETRKKMVKPVKTLNDLLLSGSIELGMFVALHTGDPSQVAIAKGVVDALYAVGQRIEKRTEQKPCEMPAKR